METCEKTFQKSEYLKSVVEQYYSKRHEKPSSVGWKLLEDGSEKTFGQLMKEYKKMKRQSDKACVLLKAVEKADNEQKVSIICKEIAANSSAAGKLINMIDTAYPDSQTARKIIESAHAECYASMIKKTSEIVERAKELRRIIKSFGL
ncbi:MAG: hypothetical protein N3G74_02425 [Candidatus Micrarchaeota archaeon]|nr:hypothetical protein [Candidatus Micrarchaeota archaeon]